MTTTSKYRNVFILGSGFSRNLGLPLQSEFTSELLNVGQRQLSGPAMQKVLEFVQFAFHPKSGRAKNWPDLEDVFTCIDMSANTGHNLGSKFTPKALRTIRRLLISRIIRVLYDGYENAKRTEGAEWEIFRKFINKIHPSRDVFVALNWDTIIESGLSDIRGIDRYSYGCNAVPISLPTFGNHINYLPNESTLLPPRIIKMHGSINWLYCDNCRRIYYVLPKQISKVATQIVRSDEWADILPEQGKAEKLRRFKCKECKSVDLTTRIATFSYIKALNSPMLQRSWQEAEIALRDASRWVFIGYSLPSADYEFKYLLKRVQLSRTSRPNIILVTGNSGAKDTKLKYQRFFGETFELKYNFFKAGLDESAIKAAFE